MSEIDEATRVRYVITGWPVPVGEERCTRVIGLTQCRHRRAPGLDICQQHQRQFLCCGGTGGTSPEHTSDCNRKEQR